MGALINEYYECIELIVEFLTALIAFVGTIICAKHALYFRGIRKSTDDVFACKLEKNFAWDAALFFVTFIMGVSLFFGLYELMKVDMVLRVFALFGAVVASVRLYLHYKTIHENSN